MQKRMYKIEEIVTKIQNGEKLVLAGDEEILKNLPSGQWIGGTIPYFMSEDGGKFTKDEVYVTELPSYMNDIQIKVYDDNNIDQVYANLPDNGLGIIIIPATSSTHLKFAMEAPLFDKFAYSPLIGWISGVDLADLGKITPKVVDGSNGTPTVIENGAVVIQMQLPANKYANMGIVNIFEMSEGDELEFFETGFSAKKVLVNGQEKDFVKYVKEMGLDIQLPLVTDFSGARINISFQEVKEDEVVFYAPVFKGLKYKHAAPVGDYVKKFEKNMPSTKVENIRFSCNCILNYLYGQLEGKKTGKITGPITFGEVAYQLLNQTLAYVTVQDK